MMVETGNWKLGAGCLGYAVKAACTLRKMMKRAAIAVWLNVQAALLRGGLGACGALARTAGIIGDGLVLRKHHAQR